MKQEHVNWSSGGAYPGMDSAKQAQVCKPDYERLIAERKERLEITEAMFHSVKDYIRGGGRANTEPLKDLLGHLLVEIEQLQEQIAGIIRQQERDTTKDQG